MKDYSYTYFCINGNFITKDVISRIGIEPVEKWDIGDAGEYNKTLDFSNITLVESDKKTFILEEQIDEIVELLFPKIKVLQEISRLYDVRYVLQIVGKATDETLPAISFNKKIIEFCYLTGTIIDCDLYN